MAQIVLANLTDVTAAPISTPVVVNGTFTAVTAGYFFVKRTVSANLTFHMPSFPGSAQPPFLIVIKDTKGDAGTNPITIVDDAGKTFDGATQLLINTPYGAVQLMWTGTEWSQIA